MLTALITPTTGEARVAGYRLGSDDDAIRASVGILTETPGLYERLSARQNLRFFARLYGLDNATADRQVERYLRLLGLWERRDDRVAAFSKGMRQKLAIARAVLHEPHLVFLDEPTSGLDPEAARIVRRFIADLRQEGRTIFLTTHNLPEADELCDLIAVFRTRLLDVDTPQNLRSRLFGRGTRVRVVGDAAVWLDSARALPFVREVSADGDVLTVTLPDPDLENPQLVRALVLAGAEIRVVEPLSHSLEEVYLGLMESSGGKGSRNENPATDDAAMIGRS
jgi:ABC-2 type transport system ATP-binding protein